jgi:predicted homoserine dehydrogenase-like protein
MEGPRLPHVRDLLDRYDPKELLDQGVIECVLGAEPGSGAFVVGFNDDPMLMPYMSYFKLGDGPLYIFYRPFHLTHLEAPLSVARAVLFGDATIEPRGGPLCEVAIMAKRDLEAGEELDGIGGYTCYGLIDNLEDARRDDVLTIGLAAGARLTRPVAKDQSITNVDVHPALGPSDRRPPRPPGRAFRPELSGKASGSGIRRLRAAGSRPAGSRRRRPTPSCPAWRR